MRRWIPKFGAALGVAVLAPAALVAAEVVTSPAVTPVLGAPVPVGSTTPTTTTLPPTTTEPPPRHVTLLVTGDIIPHDPVTRRGRELAADGAAYDFGPMFDRVRADISAADLAICHLETPLSADSSTVNGYPVFSAPAELAHAIAGAGYDGCSTASNHAYDQGRDGVLGTVAVLDGLGLGSAGMAQSPERDAEPTWYEPDGGDGPVRVAHLSYTYGLNGFALPADGQYLVDLIDPAAILADAAAARAAGAEVVVVSLHWGVEYRAEPTGEQTAIAAQLLPSPDIDLIVGHHAHVVQPIERIGDEYVVYGLGNLLSNQSANCCPRETQDGVMVELDLTERPDEGFAVTDVRFLPTWVDRSTYTVIPIGAALADPATGGDLRSSLQASWDRTVDAITSRGAVGPDAAR